jgi:hypothetical protein
MHRGGRLVSLEAVLDVVDSAGLEWHLTDLEAIAKKDSDLDVVQLENDVHGRPGGLLLTDAALRLLAAEVDQIIDCQILGVPQGESIDADVADVLDIVAFDSTEWILRVGTRQRGRLNHSSSLLRER